MAVPTPIAHWTLYDAAGTSTILDIVNGYEADVTDVGGSGGDFGATGRNSTITGFANDAVNNSFIAPDLTASPALASDFNGELGSLSIWAKVTQQGSTNSGPAFAFSSATDGVGILFENVSSSDKPSGYATHGAAFVTVVWDDLTTWPSEWLLWTITWNSASNRLRFYVNDTLIGSTAFPAATGSTDMDSNSALFSASAIGTFQDVRVWNVELTQSQITSLYVSDLGLGGECKRTIKDIETLWKDVEATLPCKARIQKDGVLGWEEIATNVHVSIELTGTRQELDSSDNYITIQNWVVTMSGRVKLPNPGAFSTVRFLVAGLTLESYTFYQSPDDIQTVIECRQV